MKEEPNNAIMSQRYEELIKSLMETVPCNLCGSTKTRLVYRMPDALYSKDEWFNVVECTRCGLGFVNPRPGPDEIFRYYPPSYYEYFNKGTHDHQRRYQAEADLVHQYVQPASGKRLLDVGCANGDFPRHMKSLGWEVEGVEASPNSQRINDFTIYEQVFTDIPVHEPRYDVVTAWAVLEHVHDPKAYFEKAAQVLKPGGIFIFLVTNFASLSSRRLFREDIPRHLYFFTESTVRGFLGKSGMKLNSADYSNRIYEMRAANWLYYYLFRFFTGRRPQWQQLPQGRLDYITQNGLEEGTSASLRYALTHPHAILDRLSAPLYEKVQMLSKSYGIVTYVATKR